MKKYILIVFSLVLFCNLAQATDISAQSSFTKENIEQASSAEASKLSDFLNKAATERLDLYANERVRHMCQEWFGCVEWANRSRANDLTFQVVDVEVERWVSKWEKGKAVWVHRFYAKTAEKDGAKAYLFKRDEKTRKMPTPVLIKNFPNHPIPNNPSEHVSFSEYKNFAESSSAAHSLCNAWKGCGEWGKTLNLNRAVISQYIYKYDENNKPLWKFRLYVEYVVPEHWYHFSKKFVYFQAYQTEVGGEYIYQGPIEMNAFPSPK